jgi:prepilin-type N-terminal cleavage/methylation domain-containing protein
MDKNIFFLKRGFTLIEVLVVVAIISILSSILYMNFGEAREEAVNKVVRSELKEIQLAIELYRAQNDHYPTSTAAWNAGVLVPDFAPSMPDPDKSANDDCSYDYITDVGVGSYYKLVANKCLAGIANQAEGVQADDPLARCPSSCGSDPDCVPGDPDFFRSLAIYSLGGQCY